MEWTELTNRKTSKRKINFSKRNGKIKLIIKIKIFYCIFKHLPMFGEFRSKRSYLEKKYLDSTCSKEDLKLTQFSNTLFASRPDNQPTYIPKIKVKLF